jgi:hypothetical protein
MRYLLPFIFLFISGCNKKNKIPPDILPQEKMQVVLRDMMRTDKFLDDYVFSRDSSLNKDSIRIAYYSQVFARYNITKRSFKESFYYYKEHPAQLKIVLDSIGTVKPATDELPRLAIEDTAVQTRPLPVPAPNADTAFPVRKLKKPLLRQ